MTFDPHWTSHAIISRDGKTVVFDARQTVGRKRHWHVIARSVATGAMSRIDVSNQGVLGNNDGFVQSVSGDGRHVLFASDATNLGFGGHPKELYERDLDRHTTTLVSITPRGSAFDGQSLYGGAALSRDGRYVAFTGIDTATGPSIQAWLRDTGSGTTTLISQSPGGEPGNHDAYYVAVSDDGQSVAFDTFASDMVPNDTNGKADAFMRDMRTGKTHRISVDQDGHQLSLGSRLVAFTTDGKHLLFGSDAKLTPDACTGGDDGFTDSSDRRNIYVLDLASGRVSHPAQSCKGSEQQDVSAVGSDGARVVAVGVIYTEVEFMEVRGTSGHNNPDWKSSPTSITSNGRFIGVDHFDTPDEFDSTPGAVIWDTVRHTAVAAWEFGGQ